MRPARQALVTVPLLTLALPCAAQSPVRPWKLEGELGAAVFFGASDQVAVLSRGKLEHKSSRWELSLSGSYDYGEAEDPDAGRFVNKRAWLSRISVDHMPQSRVSPFVFGSAEGSLQRQLDARASGGAGARLRFIDTNRSRVDVSIAALYERTIPRDGIPGRPGVAPNSIGRWSGRFHANHRFAADRMQFDLVTFYKPGMDHFEADYSVELNSSLMYSLTRLLGLKLSMVYVYDSLAWTRGARSDHDGQLFFSVLASVK
jgi:hypothetical protein